MGYTSEYDEQPILPQRWMVFAAVFTLMQGALLLSAAAIGLSLYNCAFSSSSSSEFWHKVHFYYFSNWHCRSNYKISGDSYSLDGVNNAALRTMIIMCIYIAFSSIWIIGSFLLLASAVKGKHMRPNLGRYLHSPWLISMTLIIILDAVATILYLVDLASTSEFSSLQKLLNIQPVFSGPQIEKRSLPPIIMALLTSKGVLLWIINIVVMILIIKQLKKLYVLREDAQIVRAQLANIPEYMLPSTLLRNKQTSKDDSSFYGPTPTLPRLMSKDGKVVGVENEDASSPTRASALQIAARQGFSYEHPPNTPLSSTSAPSYSPRTKQANSPQKFYDAYSQDKPGIWNTQTQSPPLHANNGSNSILQKGNDVFY